MIYNPAPRVEPKEPRPIRKVCNACLNHKKWHVIPNYMLVDGTCDVGSCDLSGLMFRADDIPELQ